MMMFIGRSRYTRWTLLREAVVLAVGLVFSIPLWILVTGSLKTTQDAYERPLSFPGDPTVDAYSQAWSGKLDGAFVSSAVITVGAVVSLVVFGSLCAYGIARRPGKLSLLLDFLFVLGIILPFQLAVIPIYSVMRSLGLVGTYVGMIVLYAGLFMPLAVFLYTGFIRALPRDYEEAAQVDGASRTRTFVRVVFPLLRPVTGTVAILTGLIVWNDFYVSLIFLSGSDRETLPVEVYSLVGEVVSQWNVIFAGVVISIIPVLVFFLLAQRHLIRGFAGGIRG